MPLPLAGSPAGETYTPEHLFSGTTDVQSLPCVVVTGQNLAAYAVVGKITASGKVKEYDPAAVDGSQTPVGILVTAADATSADVSTSMFVAGTFNPSQLVWKGTVTAAQKASVFDRTPIILRDVTF